MPPEICRAASATLESWVMRITGALDGALFESGAAEAQPMRRHNVILSGAKDLTPLIRPSATFSPLRGAKGLARDPSPRIRGEGAAKRRVRGSLRVISRTSTF